MQTFPVEKQSAEVTNYAMAIHRGAKVVGASPRNYFSFMNSFKNIYLKIKSNSGSQNSHLENGLKKLQDAKELVDRKTDEA